MDYYLYTVELPFSKVVLHYRELNSREQLILGKANTLLAIEDDETFLEYSSFFKKIISDCVRNKEDFFKLNLIDYMLFLTKLRIVSIGNQLDLCFESEEKEEIKQKITIDLNIFMKNLYEHSSSCFEQKEISFQDFYVELDWPNIKNEETLLDFKGNSVSNHVILTIPEYVKKIKIKDKKIILDEMSFDQKNQIFERLPITIRTKIQNIVLDSIKKLSEKNFFAISKMDYLKYSFYSKSLQEIIRLFFAYDLQAIYKEYYILASKNINPQYIDNLSVSERNVFCNLAQEELKNRDDASNNSQRDPNSQSLQNLMDEFGG
jgi:hypothetical protein